MIIITDRRNEIPLYPKHKQPTYNISKIIQNVAGKNIEILDFKKKEKEERVKRYGVKRANVSVDEAEILALLTNLNSLSDREIILIIYVVLKELEKRKNINGFSEEIIKTIVSRMK